jgi:antitoxin HigA-1
MPENRVPTHPGKVLLEDFLKPIGISQTAFAKHVGIPKRRLNEIVRGKRGITPDTTWLFSQAFGNSPLFWMNLQTAHDLTLSKPNTTIKLIR